MHVEGGWIDLPKQKVLDFFKFKMEISQFGVGQKEDGSQWIGFSGGIRIVEGLPLQGAVEGLKIVWNKNCTKPTLELSG
ncbi:MAG: hypothetical protein KDD15_34595, partial [Lewinella sp.]|nr:hypothetical protein [Lewinella sp.]